MKRFLLSLLPAVVHISTWGLAAAQEGFVCEIPTSGCQNGMFNVETCVCECIPPYCIWQYDGTCTLPSGNCGGNPWADCTRGENCPWWINPLKDESCTTGPEIPPQEWNIYNTRKACCSVNFPYSSICNRKIGTDSPTKMPTLTRPEEAEFEVIPLKFDLRGLPDDIRMRELKDETTTVLKRILLRLADRIPELKVSSVEEKVLLDRHLLQAFRILEEVSLYYNVYVVRQEGRKFGPLIIEEIRRNYDEVMEQLQTFADTQYFGSDIDINLCTTQGGGGSDFTFCIKDVAPPSPARVPASAPLVLNDEPDQGGLAGWAIALIVIFVLLIIGCIGYFVFMTYFRRDEGDTKEVRNNIYFDNGSRASDGQPSGRSSRSRRSRRKKKGDGASEYTSGRSRRSRRNDDDADDHELQLAIAEQAYDDATYETERPRQIMAAAQPEEESQYEYDETYTANTRETRKSKRSSTTKKSKKARDPTFYVPGQEDKPDPDSNVLMLEGGESGSSRRYYSEDPPLKPKREPTAYFDGQGSIDPSVYGQGQQSQRDPSIFVDETAPNPYGMPGNVDGAWAEESSYRTREPDGM